MKNIHLYHSREINSYLSASARQQIFSLHSRLAYRQWSLAPDIKICAAFCLNMNLFLANGIIFNWLIIFSNRRTDVVAGRRLS